MSIPATTTVQTRRGRSPRRGSARGAKRPSHLVRAAVATALVLALASTPASALEPSERLPDPAMEARARELSANLRCLVCQNQSIDDSNAPLAKDLRLVVRERLQAGDSNDQVMTYVVARYGDFVLLKPPFKMSTLLLWLAPLLGLVGIGYAMLRVAGVLGGGTGAVAAPGGGVSVALTADEEARLREVVGDGVRPRPGAGPAPDHRR